MAAPLAGPEQAFSGPGCPVHPILLWLRDPAALGHAPYSFSPSWLLEKLSGWDSVPPGAPDIFVLVLQRAQSSFPLSLSREIFIEILTKGVGWGPTQVPRRFNAATLGPAGLLWAGGRLPELWPSLVSQGREGQVSGPFSFTLVLAA